MERLRLHVVAGLGVGSFSLEIVEPTAAVASVPSPTDVSVGFGVDLDIPLGSYVRLGPSLSWRWFDMADETSPPSPSYLELGAAVRVGLPVLNRRLWPHLALTGGVTFVVPGSDKESGTGWHIAVGLGVDVKLSPRVGLVARLAWQRRVVPWNPNFPTGVVYSDVTHDEGVAEFGVAFGL